MRVGVGPPSLSLCVAVHNPRPAALLPHAAEVAGGEVLRAPSERLVQDMLICEVLCCSGVGPLII